MENANNKSRTKFTQFTEMYNLDRDGRRNAFNTVAQSGTGVTIAFSESTEDIEARQFYDDFDALICLVQGKYYTCTRDELKIDQAVNRIQPKTMINAHKASCPTTGRDSFSTFADAHDNLRGVL